LVKPTGTNLPHQDQPVLNYAFLYQSARPVLNTGVFSTNRAVPVGEPVQTGGSEPVLKASFLAVPVQLAVRSTLLLCGVPELGARRGFHSTTFGRGVRRVLRRGDGFGQPLRVGVSEIVVREYGEVLAWVTSLVDVGGHNGTTARAIARAFPHVRCSVVELRTPRGGRHAV